MATSMLANSRRVRQTMDTKQEFALSSGIMERAMGIEPTSEAWEI